MAFIRHILLIVLLTLATSLKSQDYIKTIELSTCIDNHICRPYYQLTVTNKHNIVFEIASLDVSNSLHLRFNSTLQQQAGNYRYMLNNIEEPFFYSNSRGSNINYMAIGYSTPFRNYRTMIKVGTSNCKDHTIVLAQNIRLLGRELDSNYHLDFNLQFKSGVRRDMIILGYSYGIDF